MEACSQLLRRWQSDNFRSAIARVYRIGDTKGIKHRKQAKLWLFQAFAWHVFHLVQLVFTVVKYGPLLLWDMIPQKSPPHMSFILTSWKKSWVSRKTLILTACSAKQVRCPFFLLVQIKTVCSYQTILFLRKFCGRTFLLQTGVIHELIWFCTRSNISPRLSKYWMPYDLASL